MDAAFWHEAWRQGRTGFHQAETNRVLTHHWSALGVPPGARVLVPLAGKTLDMRWLADQGHDVLGVELSPIAVTQFFDEAGQHPEVAPVGAFTAHRVPGITLLQGDVFDLPPTLAEARACYDRAATVALPPELRLRYARHLAALLPSGAPMLLVAFVFEQEGGPPFSVPPEEVERLYGAAFHLQHLERHPFARPGDPPGSPSAVSDAWYLLRR